MIEDVAAIYAKYASMMKYTPEVPDKKWLYKKRVVGQEDDEEDDDEEEEEQEEEEHDEL